MSSNKKILIVEDNIVNRNILGKILSEDYDVLMAENGLIALNILKKQSDDISGIVLDLMMPVMDGYTFMEEIKKHDKYTDIPIVVATERGDVDNEKRTLQLGAWDFITKPYDAEILKFRLKNVIDRSRLVAFERLKYLAEFDTLTDIYNKDKMLSTTKEILQNNPNEDFVFISFDIERFQLINAFYGTQLGDQLLKYVAQHIKNNLYKQENCCFGRIEGDVFACCVPYKGEKEVARIVQCCEKELSEFPIDFRLVLAFGIYVIKDHNEHPNAILDKAKLARRQVKGNYLKNYEIYSKQLSETIEQEQGIVNEMNIALDQNQFEVYLQPKFNIKKQCIEGAEALVRWNHPRTNTIASPAEFISIFERNGFITKLDFYIWEKTCQLLRKWLDQGFDVKPLSVNMSRVNLYSPNLIDNICQLVKDYQIPTHLLQFELTESTCAENEYMMREIISDLRKNGFTVLMDDFGSAYSSLNILNDLEIDILKIDMRFIVDKEESKRAMDILESVVEMAKKLNLEVIIEGVETKRQLDAITRMGCEYAQGYYFAKPMPIKEYEIFTKKQGANKDE